jgi:hypothetical protein
MVQIGGWGTAFILLVIIYSSFYHRYKILDPKLKPSHSTMSTCYRSGAILV